MMSRSGSAIPRVVAMFAVYRFFLQQMLFACLLASSVPPLIRVDLDAPEEVRWAGAIDAVLNQHSWEYSFGPVFQAHNEDLFDKLTTSQWMLLENATKTYFPNRSKELYGIASQFQKAGHPEITFKYLCGWVFFHELAHSDLLAKGSATARSLASSCTGIVARTESTFYHGRNMDQSPRQVRNCTLRIDFVRGNQTIFSGVDWYFFTSGVMTAVKKKRCGVARKLALSRDWIEHCNGFKSDAVPDSAWRYSPSNVCLPRCPPFAPSDL